MSDVKNDVIKNIFNTAVAQKAGEMSFSSNITLGIFSCARLMLAGDLSMICFAVDKNNLFAGEQIISSGFKTFVSSNIKLIHNFINETHAHKIVIACNYKLENDKDFISHAQECDKLYSFLNNIGIELKNYILADKYDFEMLMD